MPDKKRGGGTPTSAQGHLEENRLYRQADAAFDIETLFDVARNLTLCAAEMHAAILRNARTLLAIRDQIEVAATNTVKHLDTVIRNAEDAVRLAQARYGLHTEVAA